MRTGRRSVAHLSRLPPHLLLLLLLSLSTCAAPGVPDVQSEEQENSHLVNPFGSGDDERSLLQIFIHSHLKDSDGTEINTREQEVFFLFRLYDFDRSGFLDGLELMKLLLDFNTDQTSGAPDSKKVESMVDFLLLSHDANLDGLLAPSELLTPPLAHREVGVSHNPPQQDHTVIDVQEETHNEEALEEALEEAHEDVQTPQEDHHQEVKVELDEDLQQELEQDGLEILEEQNHEMKAPVHQGQPEM